MTEAVGAGTRDGRFYRFSTEAMQRCPSESIDYALMEKTDKAVVVAAALAAKGLPADSPLAGEDWFAGPYIQVRTLRLLIQTLERIQLHGAVRVPSRLVRQRANGQLAVRVFPDGLLDSLLYRGFTAEVWMEPGVTRDNLAENVGLAQRRTDLDPGVALVLGAGNINSIAPLDMLQKLFAEGRALVFVFALLVFSLAVAVHYLFFALEASQEAERRAFEADVAALGRLGVGYVFVPSNEEMYPPGHSTFVEPPRVAESPATCCT